MAMPSGAYLAQGHFDTLTAGVGDRTTLQSVDDRSTFWAMAADIVYQSISNSVTEEETIHVLNNGAVL